jgi:hypothetical protein
MRGLYREEPALEVMAEGKPLEIPANSKDLIDELVKRWPPRCIQRGETLEDHLRYAAVVEFVQSLKASLETPREDDTV